MTLKYDLKELMELAYLQSPTQADILCRRISADFNAAAKDLNEILEDFESSAEDLYDLAKDLEYKDDDLVIPDIDAIKNQMKLSTRGILENLPDLSMEMSSLTLRYRCD